MVNQVRRNNPHWRDIEELGRSSEHGKVLRRFCPVERSSIRRSRASTCICMCVCVFFSFLYSLSLSALGSTPASVTAVERDGDALFPPPLRSFHLFRSRHCMPRGDELSLPPSLFICYPPPLFFSLPLCHPCSSWQIRAVDESTRRYLDVSASTHLMRDADVFIHRRTFPILTNDAPHRTLLGWIPCCSHDFSPAIRETNSAFLKRKFNTGKDQSRAWRQKLWRI